MDVSRLASLVRGNKDEPNGKFILMLGAGASLGSGVLPTTEIMDAVLEREGDKSATGPRNERFDLLWRTSPESLRRKYLEPYLEKTPSPGYHDLAKLIKAGYFDVVLTFNFDTLLEQALRDEGVPEADMSIIVRGKDDDDRIESLLRSPQRRIKVLKLHGSIDVAVDLMFESVEMSSYPDSVHKLVASVTARNIIVCGYGFEDPCVLKAFSDFGDSVVCLSPGDVPPKLGPVMGRRRSNELHLKESFDDAFAQLKAALTTEVVPEPPPPNPFKFIDSHDVHDAAALACREKEVGDFFRYLGRAVTPRAIFLVGAPRAGKTSLARAGLLSQMFPYDPGARWAGHYIRARSDLLAALPRLVGADEPRDPGVSDVERYQRALRHVMDRDPNRRSVLFIDQFERVTDEYGLSHERQSDVRQSLAALLPSPDLDRLTVVFVLSDQAPASMLREDCDDAGIPAATLNCVPFSGAEVAEIFNQIVTAAGLEFEPRIVPTLAKHYDTSLKTASTAERFTLAHLHTFCHLLACTRVVTWEAFNGLFQSRELIAELHDAINVTQYHRYAADESWPRSAWLRSLLKVPLRTRRKVARYIIDNPGDFVPPDQPAPSGFVQ